MIESFIEKVVMRIQFSVSIIILPLFMIDVGHFTLKQHFVRR